jgi:predicted alpha/beta superfamily hydrolase
MKEYRVLYFESERLNREVKVYVMLPPSYFKSERSYPVLYMHDGQNLFDDSISYGGVSWGILDAYHDNPELPEVIVVGIENGGELRSDELVPFPFDFKEFGYEDFEDRLYGGKADLYLDFIVQVVKPYIDKTFKTFKSPKNTGLMGSSFGGLITTYAACKYQDFFSRFGAVSNAYFVVQEQLESLVFDSDFSEVKKFYMDVGTRESEELERNAFYVESNQKIYDILVNKLPKEKLEYKVIEDGIHHESEWRKRVQDILIFLWNN